MVILTSHQQVIINMIRESMTERGETETTETETKEVASFEREAGDSARVREGGERDEGTYAEGFE